MMEQQLTARLEVRLAPLNLHHCVVHQSYHSTPRPQSGQHPSYTRSPRSAPPHIQNLQSPLPDSSQLTCSSNTIPGEQVGERIMPATSVTLWAGLNTESSSDLMAMVTVVRQEGSPSLATPPGHHQQCRWARVHRGQRGSPKDLAWSPRDRGNSGTAAGLIQACKGGGQGGAVATKSGQAGPVGPCHHPAACSLSHLPCPWEQATWADPTWLLATPLLASPLRASQSSENYKGY